MGMLFGGWAREVEEEYGSWEKFYEACAKQKQYLIDNPPPKMNDDSIENLEEGDRIGIFNKETHQVDHQFIVREIKQGRIYGRFLDGRHNGSWQEYEYRGWSKMVAAL